MSTSAGARRGLAAHLDDPDWRVFDCRHDLQNTEYGAQAYAKGHIPGALFLHLDRDLSGAKDRQERPPSAARSGRVRGAHGRLRRRAGHAGGGLRQRRRHLRLAAVVDAALARPRQGRRARWRPAGLAARQAAAGHRGPGRARRRSSCRGRASMPVDTAFVAAAPACAGRCLLLDARSAGAYAGENETLDPVGGHIPGALNRFYFDNLDDAGCYFKPADELRAEFEDTARRPRSGAASCSNAAPASPPATICWRWKSPA